MLESIFQVFSKRQPKVASPPLHPLTKAFKNRVLMLLRDQQNNSYSSFGVFLEQMHHRMAYLLGRPQLSAGERYESQREDLTAFLFSCEDKHFLDFLELIFSSDISGISWQDNALVPIINLFFQQDDLPYHLTNYVVVDLERMGPNGMQPYGTELTEYPRIIRKENDFLHTSATEPALHLLSESAFRLVNEEFLKALEDHRKGNFNDCLTRCGSAFESTMKVICQKRGFPFQQEDTASKLLKTIIEKGALEKYWETPLLFIATLRNKLSSSHGAGIQPKIVSPAIASYAIHATASAIVLLAQEMG